MDWIAIGKEIRRRREAAGLTQVGLAELAEVSRQTVDFVERAQRTNTTPDTLRRLAIAVGLDVEIRLVPINSMPTSAEDHSLTEEVRHALATMPDSNRRLAVRQLRRWLEDFDPQKQ